jgi:gentisate 1,2-dioxygenase
MQIALPYEFMGTLSNSNPYCGKSLTLLNPTTGKTVQATVGDKCMGCTGRSIDCTDALFNAIVPGGDGRVSGIEWWFN